MPHRPRTLARVASDSRGFTLVELLVVILIIGVLAAIAIPTFLGQSAKAKDTTAKQDVRNAVSAMEVCATEANRRGSTCTAAVLNTVAPGLNVVEAADATAGTTFFYDPATGATAPTDSTYSLVAWSKSGNAFAIKRDGSGTTRMCTSVHRMLGSGSQAPTGGCPGNTSATPATW